MVEISLSGSGEGPGRQRPGLLYILLRRADHTASVLCKRDKLMLSLTEFSSAHDVLVQRPPVAGRDERSPVVGMRIAGLVQ